MVIFKRKKKPLLSFNSYLTIKLNTAISGTQTFLDLLEEYCKKKKLDKTDYFNKLIDKELKKNGIKGGLDEVAQKSGMHKMYTSSVKQSIKDFLGTPNLSEFIIKTSMESWKREKFI